MKRSHLSLTFGVSIILLLTATASAQEEGKEQRLKVSQIPAVVTESIRSNCANCVIARATREIEHGVRVYDIEFKRGQGEIALAEDGTVIDREIVVQPTEVPAPALAAIHGAGGKIKQIVRGETRAELKEGKLIKLDTPKYFYEAELEKGNQVAEIEVSPEGQITEAARWVKKGSKEN